MEGSHGTKNEARKEGATDERIEGVERTARGQRRKFGVAGALLGESSLSYSVRRQNSERKSQSSVGLRTVKCLVVSTRGRDVSRFHSAR